MPFFCIILSQKKHILIISSWFPTDQKPFLGNFVEKQAIVLSKKYRVSFVRLLDKSDLYAKNKAHLPFDYIDVYYVKANNFIQNYFRKKQALKQALSKLDQVDLIHAHTALSNGLLFLVAKKTLNCPLVLTEHGSYFAKDFKWNRIQQFIIQKTIKRADLLIAVSEFLAKDIRQRMNLKEITIIPNPIEIEQFKIQTKNSNTFRFLHISTLSKVKNVEPILEAFARCVKKHPHIHLDIVSDESYRHLKNRVNQLGISEYVSFAGPIPHEQITDFYAKANCFVLNSNYESFSIVIAEAWASGIPIISTPVGITSNSNANLGLITNGTVVSIAQAMTDMVVNHLRYDANEIRHFAFQFNENYFLEKLNACYSNFC